MCGGTRAAGALRRGVGAGAWSVRAKAPRRERLEPRARQHTFAWWAPLPALVQTQQFGFVAHGGGRPGGLLDTSVARCEPNVRPWSQDGPHESPETPKVSTAIFKSLKFRQKPCPGGGGAAVQKDLMSMKVTELKEGGAWRRAARQRRAGQQGVASAPAARCDCARPRVDLL